MTTRRQFLQAGTAAAFGLLLSPGAVREARAYSSGSLRKFIQPLRKVGDGIPIAQPDSVRQPWWQAGVQHYTLDIGPYEDVLHPSLPNPTRLWGYGQGYDAANASWTKHLGGVIVARRGTPVQLTFRNHLPTRHLLPVDRSLPGAELADNRTASHLHGGFVPWVSDGGPRAWWGADGQRGRAFMNVLNPVLGANEAEYYYPNQQGARLLWYHDHAMGITRLNAYAGIASAFVLTDDFEDALVAGSALPGPLDPRTLYLIFQDKTFVSDRIEAEDPTWASIMPGSRAGDLWYEHVGSSETGETLDDPSEVPEFFGDTVLVNGTAYPYVELEQRQYRLRLLNACNARFLNPRLVFARGSSFPDDTEPHPSRSGPGFVQIGNEGGFLPMPVRVNEPRAAQLVLGPAERADLVLDLRDVPEGATLILYNDAPAPFPNGDAETDVHPRNPKTPQSVEGFGPNTRTLLQVRVRSRSGGADAPIVLPRFIQSANPLLVAQLPGVPIAVVPDVPVRTLTLNEELDEFGRLIQFLGTGEQSNPASRDLLFGRPYMSPPTEVVDAGATEVWEIANLTADTHPIHLHLVNAQLLSRRRFHVESYAGGFARSMGPRSGPEAGEIGWKETVRMNPGEVTRLLMRFDLPTVPFNVPVSPDMGGYEYVWHCHILEHEEHDMMRPLVVR